MNSFLKEFIEEKFNKPAKALDLGAGDFDDVKFLNETGWFCEGVDIKTGVDLELPFLSENQPFDLVYSNYLIQKLKNKEILIETAFNNLKTGGWLFIHTFDFTDETSKKELSETVIKKMLNDRGFKNISTRVFDFYDNDCGHKHWHRILEITAQK